MASTRKQAIDIAKSLVGVKQGSKEHKELVDTFNSIKPHGESAGYTSPWCALTLTSIQIKAGNGQNVAPYSYNCGRLIEYAKKMDIFIEADNYIPKVADYIVYSWEDKTGSKADCKTGADHVGMVESVRDGYINIIEGNKGTTKMVGRRKIPVNGQYIRGFITPKYKETKAEKLAMEAERISWPYRTSQKKWAYSTGAPTDKCKTDMQARGYDSKIEYSDCGYFQNTIVYHALGKKVKILNSNKKEPFKEVPGMRIVKSGTSIKKSNLKRGDILRYKRINDDGELVQHTGMYLGNGLFAESGRGSRFGVIRKVSKFYSKKKNIQILRAEE